MLRTDRVISLIILLIAMVWGYLTYAIVPDATAPGSPGPRFFPYLLTGIMGVLACWLFVVSWLGDQAARKRYEQGTATQESGKMPAYGEAVASATGEVREAYAVISSFAVLLAYIVLLDRFGFLLSTPFIVMLAARFMMGEKSWLSGILVAVTVTSIVYVTFSLILHVDLPGFSL